MKFSVSVSVSVSDPTLCDDMNLITLNEELWHLRDDCHRVVSALVFQFKHARASGASAISTDVTTETD